MNKYFKLLLIINQETREVYGRKRVIWIILDSVGIGEAPDQKLWR